MSRPRLVLGSMLLLMVAAPAVLSSQLPPPPDEWWTQLEENGTYPEATYEYTMGMTMNLTFSVEAVEGVMITLKESTTSMGNLVGAKTRDVNATRFDPTESLAAFGGLGGASPFDTTAVFQKIEDTTCPVGDRKLACTLYEMIHGGTTIKVWHSPSVPPIFSGGQVRTEVSAQGTSMTIVMTEYKGRLLEG